MGRDGDETLVDECAAPPRFTPGSLIGGRYRIERELGRGAAGAVYAARDEELGEAVALKVLHAGEAMHPEQHDRFKREVRLARRVTHRNVARTFDIGQAGLFHFLTMELVEGVPLTELTERAAPIAPRRAAGIAAQIAEGLEAAHRAGVVHRDLKPANVLLDGEGRAVITDFGVARSTLAPSDQTHDGYRLIGTPAYMAPEQVEGADVSARTDLYSLGLILYELLTGTRPFAEDSALVTAVARVQRDPIDIRTLAELPPQLATLVDALLARDPADRPESAQTVAEQLSAAVEDEPGAVPARGEGPRPPFAALDPGNHGLAVLPLEAWGDTESEHVADVVTDELIDILSVTRDLRVPARSATVRYAQDRDPLRIGAELGVRSVVDGTVIWQDDQVHISVRMVDAHTGEETWADRFEGATGDVFDVLARIAGRVAQSLGLEARLRAAGGALSEEAAAAYMLARGQAVPHDAGGFGPEGAIHAFEHCLELEPDFPLALAGAALVRARLLALLREDDPEEYGVEACRRAVAAALEQAAELPESHVAAACLATHQSDYETAARELAEALELAPTSASAHVSLGSLQCESGRSDEGMRRVELARELDPSSLRALLTAARHHALHGHIDTAERLLDEGLTADATARDIIDDARIRVRAYAGDFESLQQSLQSRGATVADDDPRPSTVLLRAYIGEADTDALRDVLDGMLSWGGNRRRIAMLQQMATEAMAGQGQVDAALAHLERATELGLIDLDWMLHCPLLDSIRGHQRFATVLEDVRRRVEDLW